MVAAVVLTVSVEVPEPPATEAGLNEQVGTRGAVGATLQVKLTTLLNPPFGAIAIEEVADAPAATVAGKSADAAIVKSGGAAVTVRPTVVSWLKAPKVPVTVTLEVATGVTAVVAIVRVDVTAAAPGVAAGGTKAQLAPSGRPAEQVSVTGLLKPLIGLTEMV